MVLEKWAPVPGPLFCVTMGVSAGTQNLARKSFFHQQFLPHICVLKMIIAMWGSFEAIYVGADPPPPPAQGRLGTPTPKPPSRHGGQGGGGRESGNGPPCPPPPPNAQRAFSPAE